MVFVIVGIAVPLVIFQMSNVAVPALTLMFHDAIVQACGHVK